ncbi:MAG TPA: hypothetical protein VHR85_12915 [Nocardioides sp.]|jgi:hypothetical protein|nr:hypothetical protein [Nocardioides sp.]
MKPVLTIAAAALSAASLAACGSNDKPTADPTHAAAHTAPASPSPASGSASPHHAPTASSSPKGAATALDPCQLVTQDEASALAHATFGPGKEEGNKVRHECVYGAQTPNVFTVFVLKGASVGDAQAEWDQLLAEAKQAAGQAANLVSLTPEPGLADRAEWVELDLAQIDVSARGLAFLHGDVGVYMIDLVRGGAAPSRTDLAAEANTVLGRLA